jgi:hypothetical protein
MLSRPDGRDFEYQPDPVPDLLDGELTMIILTSPVRNPSILAIRAETTTLEVRLIKADRAS